MKKILILISVLGLVYACNYGTYADSLKAEKKLISNPIEKEITQSYIDYAMSVIISRALPDTRD